LAASAGNDAPTQSRHVAISAQSAVGVVQCKQLAGRRRCRLPGVRERRSRGRRCRGVFGFPRLFRPHRLADRDHRLQLRDHRIGIDFRRPGGEKTTGIAADLHRDRDRLELVEGVTDREAAFGNGHAHRAGGFAAWPQGSSSFGPRWRRFQLNLHDRRGRLEVVRRKRRATGKT
jgi:hypothetical protein